MLTGNRDTDRLVASYLDDNDILEFCKTNRYFYKIFNNEFFHNIVLSRYPETVQYKDYVKKVDNWKEYFRIIVKYITLLEKEFNYKYKTEDGSPELKYLSYVCVRNTKKYKNRMEFIICENIYLGMFVCACESGILYIIKYLLEKVNNIYIGLNFGLLAAIENAHLSVVEYLLDNGADIHYREDEPLKRAVRYQHLCIIKYLVSKGVDIHAVHDLIPLGNNLDLVDYLLKNGANINADNGEALVSASIHGDLETVKYLVEHGANIHLNDDEALRYATEKGHLDVIEYLQSLP